LHGRGGFWRRNLAAFFVLLCRVLVFFSAGVEAIAIFAAGDERFRAFNSEVVAEHLERFVQVGDV
jgi:hypothetical protein